MAKHLELGSIEYVIANSESNKPRLLLHACCGPCASSVIEYLHPYFDITVYFYNPNIMPKEEFKLRLNALKVVVLHFDGVKLIVPEQDENDYLPFIKGMENIKEGGSRCEACFTLRLDKTAQFMSLHRNDYDYFATTLSVSPHKNHILINDIGKGIGARYGIDYLSSNFKKRDGYLRSIQLSKEWNIYRQSYCGCKF